MVDAEHARRVEHLGDHTVELLGAGQIVAERLLDDHASPCALGRAGQSAVGELTRHHGERPRRHRHVEGMVAARAPIAIQFSDRVAQPRERRGVIERPLHETDALCELLPRRFTERGAAMLLHMLADEIPEMVFGPVAACEAGQSEARRQQAAVGEVIDRGQQFLARQIAGHAEDHDAARSCDARQAQIARIAQWIGPRGWRGGNGISHMHHSSDARASHDPFLSERTLQCITSRDFGAARTTPGPPPVATRQSQAGVRAWAGPSPRSARRSRPHPPAVRIRVSGCVRGACRSPRSARGCTGSAAL